ncbi:MAG: type III-A CRISPR-associated protein Csm2, partial [Lachnospiraceae bacterium]|nr:type III-A CRISPR-associated protein Csm2 [Lachnospiraceae bacterium]
MFKNGVDGLNYVGQAEKAMRGLGRPDKSDPQKLSFKMTTSKVRNLLSTVSEIYNDALMEEKLTRRTQERISYLTVRMV